MAEQKEFKRRLKKLMNKPENLVCADCPERQPRWASLIKPPPGCPEEMGMGAFMCLECSGAHRRLGVHISFVRSINLDSWKEHEVRIMENGGNKKVNAMFEAMLARSGAQQPSTLSSGPERERYIRDKYERRKFYDPNALQNFESEEESSEEEQAVPRRKPVAAVSRAPSEAAQRRAAQRQARLAGKSSGSDRPARVNKVAAAAAPQPKSEPAADLLDFGSMQAPSSTAPVAAVTKPQAPPVAPPPVAAAPTPAVEHNETLDLFANMTVSAIDSAAGPAPAQKVTKTNDDIMSLFNTPQPTNNMMASPQMMMMMGQQPQMNPMMQQMMNQQNMMNQQRMMMQQQAQQQQQALQQNVPQQAPQGGMMGMNQGGMQGTPQQQQMMMMNNMANQQMNAMMMQQQQQNMQAMMMMQQQQQGNAGGMANFGQQAVPNGNQAMMGSSMQPSKPAEPKKDDPFSQFGFNAFR